MLGKVTKFQRISSKAPRGMDENLWGVLAWIGLNLLIPRFLVPTLDTKGIEHLQLFKYFFAYSMFHVTWTTFKFNRNQLGTVSAYLMWIWLIALLMCTLKWLSSIEIQRHTKGFNLKRKAAVNYTEILSLIDTNIMGENMIEDWAAVWSHLKVDSHVAVYRYEYDVRSMVLSS